MNQENLDYLKNGIKYMGFDEKLGIELAKQMKEQSPEIVLKTQRAFGQDGSNKMDAILHFKKGNESDMYFFNSYSASIKKDGETLEQTFYVNKNKGVTSKEAFNLLEGRSVNKDLLNREGEKYNAWLKLDFDNTDDHGNYKVKQFHANYGYDLVKAVSEHPIKGLTDEKQMNDLLKSLEKGNVQSVTFVKDGTDQKMFISANPQFKAVDVFDANMKKVRVDNPKQQESKEVPAPGERQGKAKKPSNDQIGDLLPKRAKGTQNGQRI